MFCRRNCLKWPIVCKHKCQYNGNGRPVWLVSCQDQIWFDALAVEPAYAALAGAPRHCASPHLVMLAVTAQQQKVETGHQAACLHVHFCLLAIYLPACQVFPDVIQMMKLPVVDLLNARMQLSNSALCFCLQTKRRLSS